MTNKTIDEAVARKLGAKKLKDCNCNDHYDDHWELTHEWNNRKYSKHLPPYSSDIKAAWEIVLFIIRKENKFQIEFGGPYEKWGAMFSNPKDGGYDCQADTAPMAICLAFLNLEHNG